MSHDMLGSRVCVIFCYACYTCLYAWHVGARPMSPCPVRVLVSLVRARSGGLQEIVASQRTVSLTRARVEPCRSSSFD
eukprot:1035648-Prymnesium_polylepis.1